jgi:hypothetical protein
MSISPFMGEFISFVRTKETEPKKTRPVVLAFGVSARFSLGTGRGEQLAALKHAPHLSGPAFQCSTTQKGMGGQGQKKIKTVFCNRDVINIL